MAATYSMDLRERVVCGGSFGDEPTRCCGPLLGEYFDSGRAEPVGLIDRRFPSTKPARFRQSAGY
jgi:hypothetical protein